MIAYGKHAFGAIELHKDYIVLYYNWLSFGWFTRGRLTQIIYLNNIREFAYKGTVWFDGQLTFGYKNFIKPEKFPLFVWFIWRRFS